MVREYSAPEGAFGCIDEAKAFGSGNPYLRLGRFYVKIDELIFHKKRKGGHAVIANFTIAKVISSPDMWHDGNPKGEPVKMVKHVVGEKVTDFMDLSKDYGPGACKDLVSKAFEVPFDSVKAANMELATGPGQPLRNIVLECSASEKANKAGDKMYTRVEYARRVPAAELADVLSAEEVTAIGGEETLKAMIARDAELERMRQAAQAPKA